MSSPTWLPSMDAFPKKSILTPIGALAVAVFGVSVLGAAAVRPSSMSWVLLLIGVCPLAVALWAYVFFALRDPDRLQTEDYRIQREYVARIGTSAGETILLGDAARLVENPADQAGDNE